MKNVFHLERKISFLILQDRKEQSPEGTCCVLEKIRVKVIQLAVILHDILEPHKNLTLFLFIICIRKKCVNQIVDAFRSFCGKDIFCFIKQGFTKIVFGFNYSRSIVKNLFFNF